MAEPLEWVAKQLIGGMPPVEARIRWWLNNFAFRVEQSVNRLRTGEWGVSDFRGWGRQEIKDTLYGIAETAAGRKLTRKEIYEIRRTLKKQVEYWDRFSSSILAKMKALAARGLRGTELVEAREKMFQGIERRAKSYAGAMEAEADKWLLASRYEDGQWFRWELNPAEHCETCVGREGFIARMKEGRLPFYPKDGSTICLYNCRCEWKPISALEVIAGRAKRAIERLFGKSRHAAVMKSSNSQEG